MTWDYDGWVMLVGVLAAGACALPGVFLVVRGMGLMGDAISHAVLPGIAVGFLVSGSRDSVWMFLGAAIAGVIAAVLTQVLHSVGKVERGAAMGTVFTILFSLGLVLMVRTADSVDIDPHCVLYGAIELTPIDTTPIMGVAVPRAIMPIVVVLLISMATISLLWKELRIVSFDPALAKALGYNAGVLQQVIMVLTAATCVACFEAVGSIMTVAFIVAPAATALLLSQRLIVVVPLAMVLGGVGAVLGHVGAIVLPPVFFGAGVDTSSSGMMAVAGSTLFVLAVLFAPGRGVVARRLALRRLVRVVAIEDALGLLYRLGERGEPTGDARVRALLVGDVRVGPGRIERVLEALQGRGLAEVHNGNWVLTHKGTAEGAGLVRAHRLWETYLAARSAVPSSHLHTAAEQLEHVTGPDLAGALAQAVGNTHIDPHGRVIPEPMNDDSTPDNAN
jgi:manganese/zinc/iron transport system permease protein